MNFALGKKLNMTQYFDQVTGQVVPVTVVKIPEMTVTRVKDVSGSDKYCAIQVGAGKKKKINKPLAGQYKSLGNFFQLAEFRIEDTKDFSVGQKLDVSKFQIGEMVNVVGTSKGRGFQGVVKRHGFSGFPASHGHNKQRVPGSIGQRWPQHVRKGLKMAGHMGDEQVTVKNLQVVEVDAKRGLLTLKGAVPGHRNGQIKIVSTGKVKPVVKIEEIKVNKK